MDLPNELQKHLGVDPETFWSILFVFWTHWANQPKTMGRLKLTEYFGNYSFGQTLERVLELTASSAYSMKEMIEAEFSLNSMKPYHFLPMIEKPIVYLGSMAYCLSSTLLSHKITTGPYHLFLNQEIPRQRRQQFLNYHGLVFQEYIHSVIQTECGTSYFPFTESGINSLVPLGRKISDGVVIAGESMVVLEYKSTIIPFGLRTGLDGSSYSAKLKELFFDSAVQLYETIMMIEEGRFSSMGLNPANTRRYYPLIVSLESLAMTNQLYSPLRNFIYEKELLKNPKIRPFQVIEVAEMERIQAAIAQGLSFERLIQEKINDDDFRYESFNNFWYYRSVSHIPDENPKLREVYERLKEKTLLLLYEHMIDKKEIIEKIRNSAYYIWEKKGGGHGHDLDDWLQAELTVLKRQHE